MSISISSNDLSQEKVMKSSSRDEANSAFGSTPDKAADAAGDNLQTALVDEPGVSQKIDPLHRIVTAQDWYVLAESRFFFRN